MRSDVKEWVADRVKLLDKFADDVAMGIFRKMPYKIWRDIAHTNNPKVNIKQLIDGCGNDYCYRVAIVTNGLTGPYEEFTQEFDTWDGSFGRFLSDNFGSPTLTYTNGGEDMTNNACTSSNFSADTCTSTNFYTDTCIPVENSGYYATTFSNGSVVLNKGCDEDDVRRICKEIINKDKETSMETSNMFNFDFGPASSNQFRMSPYGLAVRTTTNGWIAYNAKTGDLMNVDILNFDISKMIYKMPVALSAIKPGDILMHGGKPVFVREVAANGNTVCVIDYANATVADILPVKSPFGFNFFTKICPLFNLDQVNADADNPFGNMLPFLMMNGEKDGNFDPALFFMASTMTGGNVDFANNPMMMYFLMNHKDKGDILPFMLMMNNGLMGTQSGTTTG